MRAEFAHFDPPIILHDEVETVLVGFRLVGVAKDCTDWQFGELSRSEWWCPQDMFYGFLGFSYAFQYTNMDFDIATISADMVRMKQEFGATMIRMYIPESYTTELWENVIQAAIENNMGIVTQVAFPISGNDVGLPEHFIITIILFLPRLENYLTNFIAVMGSGPGVYPIPSAREQSIFCNRPICHLRS